MKGKWCFFLLDSKWLVLSIQEKRGRENKAKHYETNSYTKELQGKPPGGRSSRGVIRLESVWVPELEPSPITTHISTLTVALRAPLNGVHV